ncbi:YceI family protein [Anaeromyxobacter sp. SG64]|uniref:YceI family protein n=1 Tax=Anaeromyxobacter sp. SG64 TaxID=2925409 RepID=UPI001F59C270|nr:YceI family protein [Anaeromyxobacter sp. SG64]
MAQENWRVDGAHSGIHFTVRHMVISKVRGKFTRWNARLALDPADLSRSTVEAEIEAASIDTGVADRDTHLRSGDFLDAQKHPALKYRSRRVEVLSPERLRVTGDLTIRDTTREVVLDVEYGGRGKDPWGNERSGFTATTSLNRKDFGLTWNQALETGGVLVADRVDVEIELQAVKQAAAKVG